MGMVRLRILYCFSGNREVRGVLYGCEKNEGGEWKGGCIRRKRKLGIIGLSSEV